MNLAELEQQAVEVAGLDLEHAEFVALANEAHGKLCADTEWVRGYLPVGPGVADQEQYDVPARVVRIIKLSVDGRPYDPTNEEEIQKLRLGRLVERDSGAGYHWISATEDGTEKISVYPTPSGGEDIEIIAVLTPADELSDDDDELLVNAQDAPRAILNYVTAQTLGNAEDDTDRRDYYLGEYARLASDIKMLRYSRASRKNARIRIRGVTA